MVAGGKWEERRGEYTSPDCSHTVATADGTRDDDVIESVMTTQENVENTDKQQVTDNQAVVLAAAQHP